MQKEGSILLNSPTWVPHWHPGPPHLSKPLLTHFGNLTASLLYLKSSKGFSCVLCIKCEFRNLPPFLTLSPLTHPHPINCS